MNENITWQVFSENGEPIQGKGVFRQQLAEDSSLIMGASHVWLWRKTDGSTELEILLQKRSELKKLWAGYHDISAAGHIDLGESSIAAAVREAREEVGVEIDADKLVFVHALRTPLDRQEIDFVYTYRLDGDEQFYFFDKEVESVQWLPLSKFKEAVSDPAAFKLVPQGDAYFNLVISMLEHQAK